MLWRREYFMEEWNTIYGKRFVCCGSTNVQSLLLAHRTKVIDDSWFQVWGFLLGYYSYDSTYAERQYVVSVKKSEYETIKNQWQVGYWYNFRFLFPLHCRNDYFALSFVPIFSFKSISPEQAKRFTKFRERRGLIEKDVVWVLQYIKHLLTIHSFNQ